jgi:hypothetical protein
MEEATTSSKIINVIKSLSIFFVIFGTVCFLMFFRGCGTKTEVGKTVTTTDTLYIDKVIKIPEVREKIVYRNPVPVETKVIGKDTIRKYKHVYKDSTGVAEITVSDSIAGRLLGQVVDIKIKEREVKYQEKVVTTTITKTLKPSFVLSMGVTAVSGLNGSYGVEVGIKNSKGLNLDLGYDSNKNFTVGIKKDVFTLYKKK